MKFIDFTSFCGNWPFHSLVFNDLENLSKLHEKHGVTEAYVSSFEAIFYTDTFSADRELAKKLAAFPQYHHAICVNPTLDNWRANLNYALDNINVSAVRIYPCIHGYSLSDDCARSLAETLSEKKIPLLISSYLVDSRLAHMIPTRSLSNNECAEFMNHINGIKVIFCGMKCAEILNLGKVNETALFDMSGLRDGCFTLERLCENGLSDRIVYGSGAPLFSISASLTQLTLAEVSDDIKLFISAGSAF